MNKFGLVPIYKWGPRVARVAAGLVFGWARGFPNVLVWT